MRFRQEFEEKKDKALAEIQEARESEQRAPHTPKDFLLFMNLYTNQELMDRVAGALDDPAVEQYIAYLYDEDDQFRELSTEEIRETEDKYGAALFFVTWILQRVEIVKMPLNAF